MSVSIGSIPRRSVGNEWLGRLCLRYVNRVQQCQSDLFVEMRADLPVPTGEEIPHLDIRRLDEMGGVPVLMRLYNEAYVGAPDYQRAGWVQAFALQTSKCFDPSLVFVAAWNGHPVGFCMARKRGQSGQITGLAVKPAWRRRGFGTALLLHAAQQLAVRGAVSAHLSVAGADGGSRSLYRRSGFQE
jgi:GNAT superfamily N-acetyltransferase